MSERERFMARALELARGPAHTSPNPRVGAVVVRDGAIVAEGAHAGAGTPHAEVAALGGVDARGATLFVTLEPCTHHGRTPPCAPAVVRSGVDHVVVAMEDPDPRVSGAGIALLRGAGVAVTLGVMAAEAGRLNAPYVHHRATGRAYLTLKLALSADGRMAAPDGSSRWITGPESRRRVHARRLEADAVMVGAGTVLTDDPALDVREVAADRQPARIVVDSSGRTPTDRRVFASGAEVFIATTERSGHDTHTAWKEAGAEVLVLPERDEGVDLGALLEILGARDLLEVY
ncbi:MAG: bifunctional diaminohydroxyphosphoribosylaminopyrimidine deaminase/5-amino-6-(5-phosphoribosylamino)uracil reductase RibD, partial [Actinomycetota bacterium]